MEFEVFLSFRGPDTRDHFTSCLYHDLVEKGIRVFKDDRELQVGQKIEGELLQALEDSQIYIPIFSKGFAFSSWCLREVAHMVDCTSKSSGKKEILPVFFDVEPDDVKLRTDLYRDALSEHEKKYSSHEVKRWGDALVEVPTQVGWKLGGKGYGELIKLIVREVLLKLTGKNRCLPDHLVETDDLQRIEELLDVDSDDHVQFVIIHGTGGIGKSTLASVIFNQFRSKFNCSSFLEDVQGHCILDMQKKLLSETLGSNSAQEICDTNDGIDRIKRGLGKKKALVVVDNVDEKKQLENLAGSCDWFGCGSRIIVTLRDIRAIRNKDNQRQPSNYRDYSVKEMPLDQAIQLFTQHAYRSNTPSKDCYKFSKEVITSVGRLPLTLEVVGSLFANMARLEWDKTLEDLKQTPYMDVRQTLMISINKLDDIEKAIFLDIACFCIGEDKTSANYMWRDCGYSPHIAIDSLLLMSLIKINESNKFWMHDEVRDLGRYIVKKDNVEDAGKRSWVWIDENTLDILRSDEEKLNVRALSVGISHDLTSEELAYFPKLRFLRGDRMNFVGNFKNVLRNLRWLSWHNCKQDLLATNLELMNLVVLDLSQSNIADDWVGWLQIKMVKKLKVLDLTCCKELTKTPDFSEFVKLEKLILAWCVKLSTIDSSIGKLRLLSTLNIKGCHSLQGLPNEIGYLEYLSEIIMPSGDKPFKLSETLGNLKSLAQFEIRFHYGISLLPHSIGRLTNLTSLSFCGCKNLHELPDSIGKLEFLIELDLQLSGISTLPDSIGNLKRLKVIRLRHSKIHRIPCALGGVETLEVLDASSCSYLEGKIPWELWSLIRLRIFDFYRTPISRVPTKISGLSSLQELKISSHRSHLLLELPSSLKCLVVEAVGVPVLADLSSLSHLHHLEVCGSGQLTSTIEDIWPQRDEFIHLSLMRMKPGREAYIYRLITSMIRKIFTKTNEHTWTTWTGMDEGILTDMDEDSWTERDEYEDEDEDIWTGMDEDIWPERDEDEDEDEDIRTGQDQFPVLPDHCGRAWESVNNQLRDFSVFTRMEKKRLSGVEYLERLRELKISSWAFLESTPNLSGLKKLQDLHLSDLPKLAEIPGLGELESLRFLCIMSCIVIEQLPDLSKLQNLQRLKLYHCSKMRAVKGMKELIYLKNAEIQKCISLERLPDLPAYTKLHTDWIPPKAAKHTMQYTVLSF